MHCYWNMPCLRSSQFDHISRLTTFWKSRMENVVDSRIRKGTNNGFQRRDTLPSNESFEVLPRRWSVNVEIFLIHAVNPVSGVIRRVTSDCIVGEVAAPFFPLLVFLPLKCRCAGSPPQNYFLEAIFFVDRCMKSETTAEHMRRETTSLPRGWGRVDAVHLVSDLVRWVPCFLFWTNFCLLHTLLNHRPDGGLPPRAQNAFAPCTHADCLHCSCRSDLEKLVHAVGVSSRSFVHFTSQKSRRIKLGRKKKANPQL